MGSLSLERMDQTSKDSTVDLDRAGEALARTCADGDQAGYALLECHLGMTHFALAAGLEDAGFRLVDTRIQFLTRWSRAQVPGDTPLAGQIRDACEADLPRIFALTRMGFSDNPRLVSRFKNPAYFSKEQGQRYFEAWIRNTAFSSGSATAVYVVEAQVVGYFIYQVQGEHHGLPVVKGILSAVDPAYRGANAQLAMQAHLYSRLGLEHWYLDNTTQLTNMPVMRNHVRSGKHLEQIMLTFYRRTPDS